MGETKIGTLGAYSRKVPSWDAPLVLATPSSEIVLFMAAVARPSRCPAFSLVHARADWPLCSAASV